MIMQKKYNPYEVREELLPFAKLIKEFRRKKNMSAEELREKLGVGYATLSRIENGRIRPSADILEKLSQLGMDISLAFETEDERRNLAGRVTELENRLKAVESKLEEALKLLN